jgi:hypothetical protein
VTPEVTDPLDAIQVRESEDAEHFGACSRRDGLLGLAAPVAPNESDDPALRVAGRSIKHAWRSRAGVEPRAPARAASGRPEETTKASRGRTRPSMALRHRTKMTSRKRREQQAQRNQGSRRPVQHSPLLRHGARSPFPRWSMSIMRRLARPLGRDERAITQFGVRVPHSPGSARPLESADGSRYRELSLSEGAERDRGNPSFGPGASSPGACSPPQPSWSRRP